MLYVRCRGVRDLKTAWWEMTPAPFESMFIMMRMITDSFKIIGRYSWLWLVAIFCSSTALGDTRVCTAEEAQKAEAVAAVGRSWKELHLQFLQYAHCDDGAIAEGFSESITLLLADHWETVRQIEPMIAPDPAFRKFIIRHIDEAVPVDRLQRIARNAINQCPRNLNYFCQDIRAAAMK
ncbi:hypothetical protein [Burkholderia sp. BCC1972]|uniref:hypothetical protein n=1 Tax=Burkholderia sp. BCC1972 TaxID=2817438 RepID=UPI002ABD1B81|nr:hypothetical protein [Burkholderia sp. BCC1972]